MVHERCGQCRSVLVKVPVQTDIALMRRASLEILRAAVLRCITPRVTPRWISGCASCRASRAASLLPDMIAASTFLTKVLTLEIREWLMRLRVSLRRIRFCADL